MRYLFVLLLLVACDDPASPEEDDDDTTEDTDTGAGECEFGACPYYDVGGCVDEFGCCEEIIDNPDSLVCEPGEYNACVCHPDDPCGLLNNGSCQMGCDDAALYVFPGEHWDAADCSGL